MNCLTIISLLYHQSAREFMPLVSTSKMTGSADALLYLEPLVTGSTKSNRFHKRRWL
jgi:hypothetical protein